MRAQIEGWYQIEKVFSMIPQLYPNDFIEPPK
jgi:hypothetical protein